MKWHNLLTRAALVLASVLVIVFFLPHGESQRLRYDVGKPWMYGSMIASFDFPIYKTDETVKAEQDSVSRSFQPYYTFAPDVESQQMAQLKADCAVGKCPLPASLLSTVLRHLREIYRTGVMDMAQYATLARDSARQFRVVTGNEARVVPVATVYSGMTAYEHLLRDERLAPERAVLARCNLNEYIEPNLVYERERSETELADLLSTISPASGMVLSGQKIIDRGEIVDEYDYRVLSSLEREMKRRSTSTMEITSTVVGQTLFVAILIMLFMAYLVLFRADYFQKTRNILMLFFLVTLFPIFVSLMMVHSVLNVYILPFAMTPVFVRVFMDSRTAAITHITMVLLCAAAVKYQYEFIIIQIVAGMVAIYSLRELTRRAQVLRTAVLVVVASCAVYLSLQLMQESELPQLDSGMYYHFAVGGVFLLISYPLMYLIEKTFGFVSDVTLFELSNTNKGLLRDLSETAPGTFQHSIMVGNLAAAIASKIGANPLLVRTGALYHDIGKMAAPVFFTENQAGVNPHEEIPATESARIIISHVAEGVRRAEKAHLPAVIRNFILTHHGCGTARYFYVQYQNEHQGETVDVRAFSYPGPNPFTREQAIVMMADTVEAASRSLKEYTEESISALVNRLIDTQVGEGFFRECPITFRDIAITKTVLIERLKGIYHTRIQYPELAK